MNRGMAVNQREDAEAIPQVVQVAALESRCARDQD